MKNNKTPPKKTGTKEENALFPLLITSRKPVSIGIRKNLKEEVVL